jgi:demethylmenaquinone methyltransferase/2-methoxy-6-polyprenyl-1,4-benzoquinol methylase
MAQGKEAKRRRVRQVFSSISFRYDLLNTLMTFGLHRRWRRRSVRLAGGMPGYGRGLDLGCGSGDYISEMLLSSGNTATVIGVDFSGEMLDVARRRFSREVGRGQVELIKADVSDLSFLPARSFAMVTAGFTVRNLTDPHRALAEAFRVTKPGGFFVSLDICPPFPLWLRLPVEFYMRFVVPAVAALVAGKAGEYRWLHESLATCPDRRELAQMLNEAGFTEVKQVPYSLGVVVGHLARRPC